jgi:hypothetical protein
LRRFEAAKHDKLIRLAELGADKLRALQEKQIEEEQKLRKKLKEKVTLHYPLNSVVISKKCWKKGVSFWMSMLTMRKDLSKKSGVYINLFIAKLPVRYRQ